MTTNYAFHATNDEVFCVAPDGRIWIVASPDVATIEEIESLPEDATSADRLLNGDEQAAYISQIEAVLA